MGRRDRIILENIAITGIAAEGKALAQVDGKVLFVPQAIPGDVVDVQVTHRKKSYMEGYILRIVSPSPQRIQPFCHHFGHCGGCKWQALPYELQLNYKQQQVFDQFTRIGKLEFPPIRPIIGSQMQREYRNKLEFTFSNRAWLSYEELTQRRESYGDIVPDENALGFHVSGLYDKVLDIKHCYLQREPSNAIRLEIMAFAQAHGYSFFDLRAQTGFLRTLMIRTSSIGETMAVLAFAYEDVPKRTALLDHLLQRFPELTSLMYVINGKRNDSFDWLDILPYFGPPYICERMEDLEFKIGPKSFYQTNSEQALALYSVVREFAELSGKERVYDLYTGTGTIALFLSRYAKEVIGIEYIEEAVADARENARANGVANCRFYAGDMKDVLTGDFVREHGVADVMVLDPPRSGIHPSVVHTILAAAPEKIIYVSCNPATQARDLAAFAVDYDIKAIQAVDMFPHTHHIENVAVLHRRR